MRADPKLTPWRALWAGACWGLIHALSGTAWTLAAPPTWERHVIDDSSQGADGVRLRDLNGDGRLDIVTGWEQGGIVRAYFQPGAAHLRKKWPAVTVGPAKDVEDAVAADLDGDGQFDVVSCTEGRTRTVFFHWGPAPSRYADPQAWRTEALPRSRGKQQWMYCVPLQMDGRHGLDLLVGSKGNGASIGWWEAPASARDTAAWKYHPLLRAGWIMSLYAIDMDGDGDLDILFSDRKGSSRGVKWLEATSADPRQPSSWRLHTIGATDREVMFLAMGDVNGDGNAELVVPTWNHTLDIFHRWPNTTTWNVHRTPLPFGLARGKSAAVADFTGDGKVDIALTARSVPVNGPAVALMTHQGAPLREPWQSQDLGGPEGSKFDLLEPLDLDGDGDLDLITCEEVANLGVIWYENPHR